MSFVEFDLVCVVNVQSYKEGGIRRTATRRKSRRENRETKLESGMNVKMEMKRYETESD